MPQIESLEQEWVTLSTDKISQLPESAGIYELGDLNRKTIYIGIAHNLNRHLWKYLDTDSACLRKAKFFRVSINPNLQAGELYLFHQYKDENDGHIPRCNRRDPTRKIL